MLTISQLKTLDILKEELFLGNKRKYNQTEAESLISKYKILPEATALEKLMAFKFYLETININPLISFIDAFGETQKVYVPFTVELDLRSYEPKEINDFINQMKNEAVYLLTNAAFFENISTANPIDSFSQISDFIKRYSVLNRTFNYFEEQELISEEDKEVIIKTINSLGEINCCFNGEGKPSSRIMDISLLSNPDFHKFEDSLQELEKELVRKQKSEKARAFDYSIQDTSFKELRLNRRLTYYMTLSTVLPKLNRTTNKKEIKILDAGSPVESMFVTLYLANLGYQATSFDKDHLEPRIQRLNRYKDFKEEMINNITLEIGDLAKTPLGNEKYDAVFCHSVMEDIPDKADYSALKNMADSVKQNGFLALTVDFAGFSKTSGGSIFKGARHYSMTKILTKIIVPAYSFGFELENGISLRLNPADIDDLPPTKVSRKNYVGASPDVWQFDFQDGLTKLDERIWQYTEFCLIFKKNNQIKATNS